MAQMNKKVALVVGAFVVVTGGFVAALLAYNALSDPERNIRKGDELAAAGDYRAASRVYGRAVAKRPSNQRYIDLMEGAILKVVPSTADEARELYEQSLALQRQRTRADATNAAGWLKLLDMLEERATFLGMPAAWEPVGDTARDMAESLDPQDPAQLQATFHQALAAVKRESVLSSKEREEAEKALLGVVGKDPRNLKAWDALLAFQLQDAERLLTSNQVSRGQERIKTFETTLAEAEKANPGSFPVALAKARRIRGQVLRRELNVEAGMTALEPVLKQLAEAATSANADGATVLAAADQLYSTGEADYANQAAAILERWLASHPNDVVHQRMLTIVLRAVDPEKAKTVARRILDMPQSTVSLLGAFRDDLRADAAERVFDLEFLQWQEATDAAEKARHLEAAKTLRNMVAEMAKGRADDARLLKFDGKLAVAAGDNVTAAAKFDKVLATAAAADAEIFLLAADAAARREEMGLALTYVNRGLEAHPGNLALAVAKARVHLNLRQFDEALRAANIVLAAKPDEPNAKAVAAAAAEARKAINPTNAPDASMQAVEASEAALMSKDFTTARETIATALKAKPDDVRLLAQSARVELISGNNEAARVFLAKAIEKAPRDPYLAQLMAVAATEDPAQRVEALLQVTHPNERDRDVARYSVYLTLIGSIKRDLETGARGPDGRPRDPELLKKHLAILEGNLPQVREKAQQAGGTNPTVLEAMFAEAANAGDWNRAEEVAANAERGGNLPFATYLRARSLSVQGKHQAAAELIEGYRRSNPVTADLMRQLGVARENLGQVDAALQAYRDAYDRRPTDIATIQAYATLLQRSGEAGKALDLYRQAARVAPGDAKIVSAWLSMESAIGDKAEALAWRRRIYRQSPSDRDNALRLAVLLTEGSAEPQYIVDEQGKPRFTDAEWAAMPPARKQTEIAAMLKANLAEGNDIFKKMLTQRPDDFETGMLQARAFRRNGRMDDGERLLRGIIAASDPTKTGPMYYGLGQYLADAGRVDEALAAFAEAQKRQDPKQREGDLIISDYWFDQGAWQRAYDTLKPALEVRKEATLRRRLAEICVKLRRFDEAATLLQETVALSGGKADAVVELLSSSVSQGRGEDLWAKGQKEEAQKMFDAAEASLKRAADLQPGNALPWLAMASNLRDRYTRTRDRALLDQAVQMADKGASMAGAFWPAARLRAEILFDKGDLPGATQVLEAFLKLMPGQSEARRQLAEYYLRADNSQRAVGVLQEGIALSPNDPSWYLALGEVRARRAQFADAVQMFDKAYELAPNQATLHRTVEMRTRAVPPDWQGVVTLIRQHPLDLKGSPYLRSALGAGLFQTNNREAGLQTMREAWQFIREQVDAKSMKASGFEPWYLALRMIYPAEQTAAADAFVQEVTKGNPGPEDLRWLADFWLESGPDGLSKAQAYLDQAVKVADQQDAAYRAKVFLSRGNLAFMRKECDAAIDGFSKALEADPGSALAMNNLAYLLCTCRKENAKALELARKAVSSAATQPEFLDTLGMVLNANEQYTEAQSVLERCIRIQPMASAYLHLAQALKGLGKTAEARTALQRAVEQKPDPDTTEEIRKFRETLG